MEKSGILKTLFSLAAILMSCMFAGSQLILLGMSALWFALLFLVIAAASAVLLYFLIDRVIWPCLASFSPQRRLLWIIPCLLAGFLLVFLIPLTVYPKSNILRVTATGEKNPESQGSEVWLISIAEGSKTSPKPITELCSGDWAVTEGVFVSSGSPSSTLICNVYSDDTIGLRLMMHPWSGKARVEFNGQVDTVDLYSKDGNNRNIRYPVALGTRQSILRTLFFIADGLSIGILLLGISLWLVQRQASAVAPVLEERTVWYLYAFPIAFCWGIYLLAFWPGFISPDTVTQLDQVVKGKFYNWHPAFHTMFLWLLTRVWASSVPVVLVQILALSGLLGWGLSLIRRAGTPSWLVWLLCAFFAVSPVMGLSILTLWKDVAYSIALVALALLMLKVVLTDGKWLHRPFPWVLLAVSAALASLFRHNGPPVAFLSLAFLLLLYRGFWRPILSAFMLCTVLYFGVTGPFYRLVGVDTTSVRLSDPQMVQNIAIYLVQSHRIWGTQLSPEEQSVVRAVLPDSQTIDPVAMKSNADRINQIALDLTLRNPGATIRYFVNKTLFVTQVAQPALNRYEYAGAGVLENPFGLVADSKLPQVQALLLCVAKKTETSAWDWLFWRNAFWMYLLLYAVVIACVRQKSLKYTLLLAPVLLNALPLAVASGGQISRYILPTLILSPLFTILLLFKQPFQKG